MAGVGSTPGLLAAAAVGAAASAALEPAFELPRQDAWSNNRNRILDTQLLARLVAQGGIDLSDAHVEAHREGYADDKFDALVYLAQTVPGISEAFDLWRKGLIGDGLFAHVLVKAGLDQRYAAPLMSLKEAELVGIGDIAYGIVRGILPAPAYVPVPPPTGGTSVPRFPPVDADPEELAAKLGFDPQMLHLMVGRSGLSLAPGLAAQALFRGLINKNDFLLAIAEGDLRTEWAETLRDATRQIPSSEQFVEAHLRGWIDKPTMYAGTARHGMSQADTDLEFQIHRRPLTTHQIKQALARGASFNPEPGEIQNPYEASVHQANLGPEWYELAIALQGAYPPLFQVNRLVTAGIIDADTGADWMRKSGEADEVVTALHAYWSQTPVVKADPHVTKAENQLWTTIHSGYKKGLLTEAQAQAALPTAGVAAGAIAQVLAIWNVEKSVVGEEAAPAA